MRRLATTLLILTWLTACQFCRAQTLSEVATDDYIIRTDLPPERLELVLHRLKCLTAEYRKRTDGLSDHQDDRQLPFYLFQHEADYRQAGGAAGSVGLYDRKRLLAWVGPQDDSRTWHVIQHEAFHQYLDFKLGEIPIWLNEGLAEYFGESLFTGDGFVSGIVPPWRLERLQKDIRQNRHLPLEQFMSLSHEKWNHDLSIQHYDQAWSLVQFLAHGQNGRHRKAFVRLIGQGDQMTQRSFVEAFGPVAEVETQWRTFWLDYPVRVGRHAYARAAVETLTSYLARARLAGQSVRSFSHLQSLVAADQLRQPRRNALPVQTLSECLAWAEQLGEWQFDNRYAAKAQVTLHLDDQTLYGRYEVRQGRVTGVSTWSAQ